MLARKTHAIVGLALLAGCSTSPAEQQFNTDIDALSAQLENFGTRYYTSFSAIPTSGTMSFDSYFYVLVDNDSSTTISSGDFEAVGTGTVVADFGAAQTISGSFDDFSGIASNDQATMVGGTVAMTNGVLAATQPNDFTADVQGRLTAGSESYEIDDSVTGKFVATPIIGFIATGDGSGVLVNDSYYRAGAVIVTGEN